MSGNGREWGTVEPERVPGILFGVKAWVDDAAPRLDDLESRTAALETAQHETRELVASLRGVLWAIGIFWAVAVVLVGFWIGIRFGG